MPIQSKQQPPYYKEGIKVKEYIALLTQTGAAVAPTITQLIKNTLNATPTWIYEGVGFYSLNLTTEEFTPEKTTILATMAQYNGAIRILVAGTEGDPNYVYIKTFNKDSTATELGANFQLTITIYQ